MMPSTNLDIRSIYDRDLRLYATEIECPRHGVWRFPPNSAGAAAGVMFSAEHAHCEPRPWPPIVTPNVYRAALGMKPPPRPVPPKSRRTT